MNYKPGSVIGDYVVIGAVGAGGMGTVYKVQHVITQRIEAMKLLASGRTDPEQEQRFLREMQVQARLHHPNVAAVYNAFRFYDEFFLVMEFIEGESLQTILERGRLPLPAGIHYIRQALSALDYAHTNGVVHRDIAPSNIIITPEGIVKLTDFGLARTANDIRVTHSGAPVGSPWYMSPEQVRGDSALDARSDIYSMGAILYEIATGCKPFDLASTFDVMRAHVELPPLAPIDRVPDLPHALNEIILTAMAKDPNARFQSARQFYAVLEKMPGSVAPAAAHPTTFGAAPRAVAQIRRPPNPLWLLLPRLTSLRVAQTALGTAACGLALFGGYATYSLVRVSSAAGVPAISPVKAMIPTAPATPLPPDPPSPRPARTLVAGASQKPALPAVHHPRPIREFVARIPADSQPLRDPAAGLPEPPKPAPLPPPPVIARSSRTMVAPPAIVDAGPTSAPEPPSDPEPGGPGPAVKKIGNRVFRALHKVVPFHKTTAAEQTNESSNTLAPR